MRGSLENGCNVECLKRLDLKRLNRWGAAASTMIVPGLVQKKSGSRWPPEAEP